MHKPIAVVAHFDVNNRFDRTFQCLLKCVSEVCLKVVVVTTSKSQPITFADNIEVIERPNVGYDFYSYKVGVDALGLDKADTNLFLINSSFIVLNSEKFITTLKLMSNLLTTFDAVSLTESKQISWHLQSYLILIRKNVVQSTFFNEWLKKIQPKNNKMDAIVEFEIGLSQSLVRGDFKCNALYKESNDEHETAIADWKKWLATNNLSDNSDFYNQTHFNAQPIAEKYGVIKTELLRSNPHQLDISWVESVTETRLIDDVSNYIAENKNLYVKTNDGLTVLNNKKLSQFKLVCNASIGRKGIEIAVVVHLYYKDLIKEIRELLDNIIEPFDLFITTPHEQDVVLMLDTFEHVASSVTVVITENQGRDIAPFISLFRSGLLDSYSAVLKLHSKQSKYNEKGGVWRDLLYQELCGSYPTVSNAIKLLKHSKVGIVGPHNNFLTNPHFWGGNKVRVSNILTSIKLQTLNQEPKLAFFAGSMFWFNPKSLSLLHEIPHELLTFESEAGQRDGTLAHAIERIFSLIVTAEGYVNSSLKLMGKEISTFDNTNNTVPVIELPKLEVDGIGLKGE